MLSVEAAKLESANHWIIIYEKEYQMTNARGFYFNKF